MVLMSRPVAGLACRIRVPVRQYQAVAVLICEAGHIVRLVHRDAALSIDVDAFNSLQTAEEYRDRMAEFLDLPPLTVAGAPAVRPLPSPASASRRSAAAARRPRFLKRRQTGEVVSTGKIEGREIIARN
jgi:hypothetical protein